MLRPGRIEDADKVGRIIFEAFSTNYEEYNRIAVGSGVRWNVRHI
jgi:hypothetical protein